MNRTCGFFLIALAHFLACIIVSGPANAARLLHMDSADRIPGVYKVVFKAKADLDALPLEALSSTSIAPKLLPVTEADARQLASALAQAANGTLGATFFGTGLKGFALANVTDGNIPAALLSDPRVDFIEPAMWVHPTGSPQSSPPWHLDRIDQRNLPVSEWMPKGLLCNPSCVTVGESSRLNLPKCRVVGPMIDRSSKKH